MYEIPMAGNAISIQKTFNFYATPKTNLNTPFLVLCTKNLGRCRNLKLNYAHKFYQISISSRSSTSILVAIMPAKMAITLKETIFGQAI